jgi:hypothetical protein
MMQIVAIGIGAGAASALLFASVASGSIFATLLFYLAPLPLLIVALGWSHWAGLIGAASAAIGLGAIFTLYFSGAFLAGVAIPAWWLGYLAMLARPAPAPAPIRGPGPGPIPALASAVGPVAMEWYPVGRLVLWSAIIGSLMVLVAIANFGTDKETFQAGLRGAFERAVRAQAPADTAGRQDVGRLIDVLVLVIPPAAAVLATVLNVLNLWLAASVVKVSGRLRRPWPDLATLELPGYAAGLLAAAITGSFLPDLLGIVAGVLAASLFMAYAILGFAVLHAITRGMSNRGFMLGGAYAAVVVFGWPVLAMSLLGLADTALNIRGRMATKRGPPTLRT